MKADYRIKENTKVCPRTFGVYCRLSRNLFIYLCSYNTLSQNNTKLPQGVWNYIIETGTHTRETGLKLYGI